MDFLVGLKEALSHGISKDDYVAIWNKEMELKCRRDIAQVKQSQDVSTIEGKTEVFAKKDPADEKDDLVSLLKQITEQQNRIQLQQNKIQQQLTEHKILHEKQQQNLFQQMQEFQVNLSEKVDLVEKSLVILQQSLAECVRMSLNAESFDIHEKLSIKMETIYNHMLDELRNISFIAGGGFNKLQQKNENTYKIKTSLSPDAGNNDTGITANNDAKLDDTTDHVTKQATSEDNDGQIHVQPEYVEQIPTSKMDTEHLKHILHYELNSFLVNIQKLLLKPLTSEDISVHIISSIQELLHHERSVTADQLLSIQTAISDDIHARIYKKEMLLKQDIEIMKSFPKQLQQLNAESDKILEAVHDFKTFLYSEGTTRNYLGPDKSLPETRKESKTGDTASTTYDHGPATSHTRKDNQPGNIADHTKARSGDCSFEQVQEMMLIMSVYVLMLLMYHDTVSSKLTKLKTPETTEVHFNPNIRTGTTIHCLSTDSDLPHSNAHDRSADGEFHPNQGNIDPNHLTDGHLKFMFGRNKESHFLCDLKYSEVSDGKEVSLELSNINPGYTLSLRAFSSEKNDKLNLSVQAVCGAEDHKLTWPAQFMLTITLVDQRPLAKNREGQWNSFTKTKVLYKPKKVLGRGSLIPLCYFRDDVVHKFCNEDTIQLKISIQYIEDDHLEPPGEED